MEKRKLSLILCIVILAVSLISCSSETKKTNTEASGSEAKTEVNVTDRTTLSDQEIAAIGSRIDYLKKEAPNGYGGKDFNFIGMEKSAFPAEENITGNPESDAVYKRNVAVQDALDINIVNTCTTKGPETVQLVKQDADAGLNTYHLAFGANVTVGYSLFTEGYLAPIGEFEQIDIENPWWLSSMEEYYAIGDKLFCLSGDILPSFFDTASCVLFSKKLMEDYSINDDLYALVKDGEWTIDKMFEIASKIPGGGGRRYGNPCLNAGISLFFGSGQTITKFDENHEPYIERTLPRELEDLAVKVSEQTGDSSFCTAWFYGIDSDLGELEIRELFANDAFLFSFDTAGGVSVLRESDINGFGIVPIPKANKEQEKYVTYCSSGCIYIPRNLPDKDMVGTVTDAMAAYSYMYIRPVFYDLRLKSKSVYDIESKEMLDIIYSSQVYDLYDMYGDGSWETGNGQLFQMINNAVFMSEEGLSSKYTSTVKVTQNKIKQMIRIASSYDN